MANEWHVRPASRGDGSRCKPLWEPWLGNPFNQQMDGIDGRGPQRQVDNRLWLVETGQREVVGVLLTTPPTAVLLGLLGQDLSAWQQTSLYRSVIKLQGLAVSPKYRGRGIGSQLVSHVTDQAQRTADFMYGQFDVARKLGPFYQRLGFDLVPERAWLDIPAPEVGKAGVRIPPIAGEQWFTRYFRGNPPRGRPTIEKVVGPAKPAAIAQQPGPSSRQPTTAVRRWWAPWR